MDNIEPVDIHLIRICSLCNVYMPNDVNFLKHPVFVINY